MIERRTDQQAAGLQHVIQGLSSFWVERGCALLPPCSLEIPAALLHPKTFFRLLDPMPWQGVVAQPVSRPVDGRRGLHPFRTSVHLQLQVALQEPAARDVQPAVAASLASLGLDPARRHLRFESWHWQLDAVGARGRGWRVTLDGIGIGRVTFLERLADQHLAAPRLARAPVDVTYGVEHLALVLSGVDTVYRLPWQWTGDAALRYDQLRRTDEEEQSRYVEEVASVDHLRQLVDGMVRESRHCLEAELVRPAYERAIECLAILDVLEVRRDLSDAERVEWTGAVRQLVAGAAELYLRRVPARPQPAAEQAAEPIAEPVAEAVKPAIEPTGPSEAEPTAAKPKHTAKTEPEPTSKPEPTPKPKPRTKPGTKAPAKRRSKSTKNSRPTDG